MWEFDSELSEKIQRTPSIYSFRFPVRGKGVRYLPGQFFFLTIKVRGEEALHHFSFSTSPTDKGYIEFTKRITASEFSQTLNAMQPGTWAHLRGPSGNFILPRKPRKLGFLSGGIGITPLRSMLRYITTQNILHDVVLLYGNNNLADIAFRDELDGLAASHSNIRVEHILSGPDVPPDWKRDRGFISKELVTKLIPDYLERLFYISGPPKMVLSLEEQLAYLYVPQNQVKRDSFTGYD